MITWQLIIFAILIAAILIIVSVVINPVLGIFITCLIVGVMFSNNNKEDRKEVK